MKNLSKIIIAILIVVLVAVIGVETYFVITNNQQYENKIAELEKEIETLKKPILLDTNNTQIETEKNLLSNTTVSENQYEKIKGVYKYTTNNPVDVYFTLSLKEDGTFDYVTAEDIMAGFCGNYIINDSEIILNKLFSYGSDVGRGLCMKSEQFKLKINEDGTISDSNKYHISSVTEITLKRETTEVGELLKEGISNAVKNNALYAKD